MSVRSGSTSLIRTLDDIDVRARSVLLRADLNTPLRSGVVDSDARIRAVLPTIEHLRQSGAARIILLSHLGRPEEGVFDEAYSMAPVAECLSALLGVPVPLTQDWHTREVLPEHPLQLLENVRFCVGECGCDEGLSARIAGLADVFVMDAFATAHRAHASTTGVIAHAAIAVAGPLLLTEVKALREAMSKTQGEVVALVGGAKVSGKLELLQALATRVDCLLLGGGIANTFLHASGCAIGNSLSEPELVDVAHAIMSECDVPLPRDVVVRSDDARAHARTVARDSVEDSDRIGDIGAETIAMYQARIASADKVIWNGPVGIFEDDAFAAGTHAMAQAVATCGGFTLAGGGDTVAAIERFAVDKAAISYISTAGGAFLEYLSDRPLPVLRALEARG